MRLIDADKIDFNEVFVGASEFAEDTRNAAQMLINAQPTAYDTSKVVEKLDEYVEAQKFLETLDWDNIPGSDEPLATICYALQEVQKYKDWEEHGLLKKFPCKVGETLYRIDMDDIENAEIEEYTIDNILICPDGDVLFKYDSFDGIICHLENITSDRRYLDTYRIFLTQEQAEQKIKEIKGKNKED